MSPNPLRKLNTGSERFSAASPSAPMPLEMKNVSTRIYTDTPIELIMFAKIYLKKSLRIVLLSIS